MKKQWIVGALVAATGLQTTVPAHANNEGVGTAIGAIAGGLLGSTIGGGNGKTAATIGGAILGAVVGSNIGRNMDENDRRAYYEAQRRCFSQGPNYSQDWDGGRYGSRTGARGNFRTGRRGHHYQTREVCQEYYSTVTINGRSESSSGVACSRSDGSWYEVRNDQVRYDDGGTTYSSSTPSNGYNNTYPRSRRRVTETTYEREDRYERPRRRDDDDAYNYDRGSSYPAPVSPIPAPPPLNGQYPQQPGYQYPPRQNMRPTAVFDNITRESGGRWHRVALGYPVTLAGIMVQARNAGIQVYETWVVTESGARIQVPELSGNQPFNVDQPSAFGFTNRPDRIIAIDFRAESFGRGGDLQVYLQSNNMQIPNLRLQVF